MMEFRSGEKAEAVDQFGVWHKCQITAISKDGAVDISFPGWSKSWDQTITDHTDHRVDLKKFVIPLGAATQLLPVGGSISHLVELERCF